MKYFLLLLVIVALACGAACSLSQHAQTVVQRQPLEKQPNNYKTPVNYKPRVSGYDEKTGEAITYDHKPRLEVVDARAGKYAFKWIGFDGKEKTATFGRADAIDVVVHASVSNTSSSEYQYIYEVKNLPSSGAFLKRVIIQNFAPDVKPEEGADLMPGLMTKQIHAYSEGNWISFADVSDDVQVNPSQAVTIRLTSSVPPGLVGCRAMTETVVEGAGEEDIPSELENLLRGDESPRGYTIGPDERLKNLSVSERAQYVLDKLPQFRKLGWITEETLHAYERQLKSGNLAGISKRAEQDLKAEQITSEVFAIVQAMK